MAIVQQFQESRQLAVTIGLAGTRDLRRRRCGWRYELAAMLAVLLVGLLLRSWALSDVPPGLRYDELLNFQMAQRVMEGERPLYFRESWGEEPLFLYAQAVSLAMAGISDWSLRLPAVFLGILSVPALWVTARRMFGARVALVAAAALSLSFWSLFYSRIGLRVLAVTPFHGLGVYLLWRWLEQGLQGKRGPLADCLLSGLALGLGFYVYPAARLMPLLPALALFHVGLFHRGALRRVAFGLSLVFVVTMIVAAPLLVVVSCGDGPEQRIAQLTGAWDELLSGNPSRLSRQVLKTLGMFAFRGDKDWLYNVARRPVFEPVTAACFAIGVVLSAWRWRRPRYALALIWLGIGIAPAAAVSPPASLSHGIAAQLPAYVLMALGLDVLWRAVGSRWRAAGPLAVGIVLVAHGFFSCRDYFVVWARAPQVRELQQAGVTAVARELDATDPQGPVVIGSPFVNYWHPWNVLAFELAIRREDLAVRWFNPGGSWIWPAGAEPTVYYFPLDPLGPQAFEPALAQLFFAEARKLPSSSADFSAYQLLQAPALGDWRASTAALAWPPELDHLPPPRLPLDFQGGLTLLGAETAQRAIDAGHELSLVTYWEARSAVAEPVVVFVHLTSDGSDIWGQHDWLDVRTAGLQRGDRFAQAHGVAVDGGCPSGSYHLQVGLYRPDTLERLPIPLARGQQADRVWIGTILVN